MTDIFEITFFAPIGNIIIGRRKQFRNFCWVKDNNLLITKRRKTAISRIQLNERNSAITANHPITNKIFNLSFANLSTTHKIPPKISSLAREKDIKFTFHDGELFEVSIAEYVLKKIYEEPEIVEKNDKKYTKLNNELIELATNLPVKVIETIINHKPTFLYEFGFRSDFIDLVKKVMKDKINCRLLLETDQLSFIRWQDANLLLPKKINHKPHELIRKLGDVRDSGGLAAVSQRFAETKIPAPELPLLSSQIFSNDSFDNVRSPSVCLVSNFTIVLIEARFPYTQHFIPTNFYDLNTIVINYKTFSDEERDRIKASYPESAKIAEVFSDLTPQGWNEVFY